MSARPSGPPAATLIVDDDPAVLTALGRLLHNVGIVTLTAASGDDALAVLEEHASTIGAKELGVRSQESGVRYFGRVR